ncbi:MAG: glycosyltransferase [Prevotella sp.]|nr:glycosyltransferase [Prevotella sp.]
MSDIKFSVVIPSYKTSEEVMTRTIESVLAQNYKPYEIIVVDDNGGNEFTDINKKLQNKYSEKVQFEFYPQNMGANHARNTGIKAATGDFIAFLDSDDEWYPIFLEEVVKCINNKSAKFISVQYFIRTKTGRFQFSKKGFKEGDISKSILFRDLVGPTSSVVVEKNTIIDAGLFDEALPARQDYDMWIRVAQIAHIYYIDTPLLDIYRDGHDSISRSYKRNVRGTQMVLDKILVSYDLSEYERKSISYAQNKRMAMSSAHGGNFKDARMYSKRALMSIFSIGMVGYYILYSIPPIYKIMRKQMHKMREFK